MIPSKHRNPRYMFFVYKFRSPMPFNTFHSRLFPLRRGEYATRLIPVSVVSGADSIPCNSNCSCTRSSPAWPFASLTRGAYRLERTDILGHETAHVQSAPSSVSLWVLRTGIQGRTRGRRDARHPQLAGYTRTDQGRSAFLRQRETNVDCTFGKRYAQLGSWERVSIRESDT